MQHIVLFLVVASAPLSLARRVYAAGGAASNPLGTVLSLIDELAAKVVADGETEQKAYHEYYEWCDETSHNLQNSITTASSRKEKLEAQISKLGSDIEVATSEIEKLAGAAAEGEADLKKATAVRAKEVAIFEESQAELENIVGTLDRALNILERQAAKSGTALAQIDSTVMANVMQSLSVIVDAASLSSSVKSKLLAFVETQDDADQPGAPAAEVYKDHSGGILELLADLKDKSETELAELRQAETKSKGNYKMLRQSLEDQTAQDQKHLDEEKSNEAAAEEGKAGAEGDLTTTVAELKAANTELEETRSTCMTVAADHAATVASNKEELKVIAEAKKILQDTTGGAVEQTYSFIQLSHRSIFAHTRVIDMVKKLAAREHSAALAQLASRISAVAHYGAGRDDPFVKVKGLIESMISKLQKEAEADATEKAYCDEQMSETETKKSDLESDDEKMTTKIDQASSKSGELKEEVKALEADLATLVKEQAEMDTIRQDQHAAYKTAKADLELGVDGVRKAIGVLKDYYAQDDEDSFSQQPAKPATFKRAEGAGSSIIGILEVCESDFATGLAKVETEEADEVDVYEKTTQDNKVTTATKTQDAKGKTQEFKSLDVNIAELTGDRDTVRTELAAVNEYYAKVQERCVAKPETYLEAKQRRESEIAGLKEALSVLSNEAALVQRNHRAHHAFLSSQ